MREGKSGQKHDISSLSQVEREKQAEREIAMLAETRKAAKKKDNFGVGTDPGLKSVHEQLQRAKSLLPEDDFSDQEVTKVHKRTASRRAEADRNMTEIVREIKKPKTAGELMADIKEEMEAEPSQETKAAMATMKENIQDKIGKVYTKEPSSETIKSLKIAREMNPSPTEEALKTVKELSSSHNDPDVVFERIAGHVEDNMKKAAREKVARAAKPKNEGLDLRKFQTSPELEANNAQAAYAKAYTEYDPKFRAKIARGNKPGDAMANYDLIAAIRPPRLAFLTAKGRELNRLYKEMRDKFKAAGEVHDKNVEMRQAAAEKEREEGEWDEQEWEAQIKAAKKLT